MHAHNEEEGGILALVALILDEGAQGPRSFWPALPPPWDSADAEDYKGTQAASSGNQSESLLSSRPGEAKRP
jgi:hypothetical protein